MLDNVLLVELGQMLDQGFPRPDVTSWYSSEFHARVLRILDVIYTQRVKEGADGGGALPERDALTVVRFCKAYEPRCRAMGVGSLEPAVLQHVLFGALQQLHIASFKGYLQLRDESGSFTRTFAEHDCGTLFLYSGALKKAEMAARGGIDLAKVLELTYDGASSQNPFASRSARRALLTPQVNPGSLYRRGKGTQVQPVGHRRRKGA